MSKFVPFFKRFALSALVLAIGLAALPAAGVSAAGLQDETTPAANRPANGVVPVSANHPESSTGRDYKRLQQIWARAQTVYQRQSDRLAKVAGFITKAQSLIDKANQKGWDTSTVQSALNAFSAVIPSVQAAHNPGAAIIANHNGFTADGKVTDRAAAVETVKALGQVLKDTRLAMNGTGQALREAVNTFRDTHRPAQAPAAP